MSANRTPTPRRLAPADCWLTCPVSENQVAWLKKQAAAGDALTIAEKRQFLARLLRVNAHTMDGMPVVRLADKIKAIQVDNDLGEHELQLLSQAISDMAGFQGETVGFIAGDAVEAIVSRHLSQS